MADVYLSLGSNMGDRTGLLSEALSELNKHPAVTVVSVSSVYETAPVGYKDQDLFLNIAARIETSLKPLEFLAMTQGIEEKMGRKKIVHWGPRVIDIDIISYDTIEMHTEKLTIPHKEALQRAFVLLPLLSITPEDFSLQGKKIKDALKKAPHDHDIIWLYQETLPF